MKRGVWSAIVLGIVAFGPTACGETPEQTDTGPAAPEGIAVTNARLLLPAVAGNPGAVYFDVANSGTTGRMIRAASVTGAGSSMMHTTTEGNMAETLQVMVPPGGTLKFEPGGAHVMAMNLADTVKAGSKADVTLTFVGGDKISFPADVRAAGDDR
jgi:periplasmic copper chaperone A